MSQKTMSQAIRESRAYPALRRFSRGIEKSVKRILNLRRFKAGEKEIRGYRDAYQGQRCFIIGNGPSLRVADLDRLKGEFSIASNSIYRLFGDTAWRPTMYTAHDFLEIKTTLKEIFPATSSSLVTVHSPVQFLLAPALSTGSPNSSTCFPSG